MKALLIIALLSITCKCGAFANTNPDKENKLVIQGKFTSELNVNYEVYQIESDSCLTLVESGKFFKYININVDTYQSYLIKFTAKDGKTKYLQISVEDYDTFIVVVDFKRTGSARMIYNADKSQYQVTPLRADQIASVNYLKH